MPIARASWLANRRATNRGGSARNVAHRPAGGQGRWSMSTPTVNAFYSSAFNSINFPAGICSRRSTIPVGRRAELRRDGRRDRAQMTHGFDDRGRQFDADGNLRDWWTPSTPRATTARRQGRRPVDAYTVNDTLHVNGRVTLSANIADPAVSRSRTRRSREGDRRQAARDPRRLHARAALLPRVGARGARSETPEDLATLVQTDSRARRVARERPVLEPRGVRARGLQGRRSHGAQAEQRADRCSARHHANGRRSHEERRRLSFRACALQVASVTEALAHRVAHLRGPPGRAVHGAPQRARAAQRSCGPSRAGSR